MLEVYHRAHDPGDRPVVCLDENLRQQPSLLRRGCQSQPNQGAPERYDYEYATQRDGQPVA